VSSGVVVVVVVGWGVCVRFGSCTHSRSNCQPKQRGASMMQSTYICNIYAKLLRMFGARKNKQTQGLPNLDPLAGCVAKARASYFSFLPFRT
jgi:hypothetical protein